MSWFEDWHGGKLPAECISGLPAGVGSTAMSTGVTVALSTKASVGHGHAQADIANLVSTLAAVSAAISTKAAGSHTHNYEPANANIQAHIASAHAPSNAQANADITKAEIEAQLTGQIATHSHAGGAGGGIPSTWATLSTHVLTGSTTMQSVTGLSFPISSAALYRFEFVCGWQTISSATGLAIGVTGPASPLLIAYEWAASTGMGGLLTRYARTFGAQQIAIPGSSAANVDGYGYCGGMVRTGPTAGTLQLQFASEVAGSTVSVRAGSAGLLFGPL